jgi:hypothetical protein
MLVLPTEDDMFQEDFDTGDFVVAEFVESLHIRVTTDATETQIVR